eukprot:3816893-Lingulodinium_polyedra.AAC.1
MLAGAGPRGGRRSRAAKEAEAEESLEARQRAACYARRAAERVLAAEAIQLVPQQWAWVVGTAMTASSLTGQEEAGFQQQLAGKALQHARFARKMADAECKQSIEQWATAALCENGSGRAHRWTKADVACIDQH